jgi:acetyl esterase/lipase
MRRFLAWGVLVASAAAVAEVPRKIPVGELFANPELSAPELSDDGRTFAYIFSQGDLQIILTRAVAGGEPVPLARMDDPEIRLAWLEWANSERLFISGQARNLPAIALVHGGQWARDSIRWDPEVQLLANRGIADPDRIGITGGSYGGYATLVGLVKTPELYRAGAAYAPVTDIEYLISDDKWYDWGVSWHETMVGGGRADRERLRQSSPLRRAGEIRVPVLLGHGEDDQRVHVRQSRRMAEALEDAGKQVEYMEFPDEVHGFLLEANRVRWYERMAAFFEEHLAARQAPGS